MIRAGGLAVLLFAVAGQGAFAGCSDGRAEFRWDGGHARFSVEIADDDAVVFKQCLLHFPSAESKRGCKPAETIYNAVARYRIGIGIEMQRVSYGATCARTAA